MFLVALFDIDGTLCDPGTGITDAVRHALRAMGVEERDDAALRRFVGPPLEHSFRDFYGFDPSQVEEASAHYRAHYAAEGLARYRAYPGVSDLLTTLGDRGVRLGVVTAKGQAVAEQALAGTGLLRFFESVHGRAPGPVVTKDVTMGEALARFAVPASDVVMVGDRQHDVLAARHHGVDAVGLLHGYGTRAELEAAGARWVVADAAGVAAVLGAGSWSAER
ncbi:HAD hydrolase-like protein [Cellulomonas sp. IC4_254]|uniref:HAD hydrolase-like protein n=1 Tax=Cellulomonas sp. IC4_254 TaxID=2714040 RepID=UPI001422463D|nr:HAD hydrolase-like protein [Cellulomonas sp. IC4_254]NHT16555.1 HAD hydrolase-like protein [Cellulomonas sp. IC4_254]